MNSSRESTREKAQRGLQLLKEAVLDELRSSARPMTHAELVRHLEIQSDFEGNGRNYLSWSILGLLVNGDLVRYRGDGQKRVYYLPGAEPEATDAG